MSRFGRKAGAWGWSQAGEVRFGRPLMALLVVGLAGSLAFTWWPNGEYRPIQPGEKGTVADAVAAVSSVDTGRPGLTPEKEAELDGAPTQAWDLSDGPTEEPAAEPAADDEPTAEDETPATTVADSGEDEGEPTPTPTPTPNPLRPPPSRPPPPPASPMRNDKEPHR